MALEVYAEWDADAAVWIATSEDIPGLCVQADDSDELLETVIALAPELLSANHVAIQPTIPLHIRAERTAMIRAG